jgi:hypothetical protein
MSEVRHTPGPWTCRVKKPFVPDAGGTVMIDAPGWLGIAKVYLHCTGGAEGEANARLIAAALDLLAACEALPLDREFEDAADFKDNASRLLRAMDLARAAITKAKGGA